MRDIFQINVPTNGRRDCVGGIFYVFPVPPIHIHRFYIVCFNLRFVNIGNCRQLACNRHCGPSLHLNFGCWLAWV